MIHNLTPQAMKLYFEYTLDFIRTLRLKPPVSCGPVRSGWTSRTAAFTLYSTSGDRTAAETMASSLSRGRDQPLPARQPEERPSIPANGMLIATTGPRPHRRTSTDLYLPRGRYLPGAELPGTDLP